jgi:hypothetical protein
MTEGAAFCPVISLPELRITQLNPNIYHVADEALFNRDLSRNSA